jgi:hypothetical protein
MTTSGLSEMGMRGYKKYDNGGICIIYAVISSFPVGRLWVYWAAVGIFGKVKRKRYSYPCA